KKKDDVAEDAFSLYAAFSKSLNSISVGNIDIINSKFNIYKNGMDTLSVFSTNDNSISIKNFSVNSETDKKNRLFFAEKFEVVMNKFSYHFRNELYTLYGKSLYASYIDSTLIVDSLQLVPNFSKKEFGDMADNQISRAEIIASKVICQKMDVKLFFEYNSLVIHKVDLVGCVMDIYRDNTRPLKHIERPSIQTMVKGLPFFLAVDTIEMKNCEIAFALLSPGENSTGKIAVNKFNAIITGAQNDTTLYTEVDSIKAILNGRILNQGEFNITYSFPLKAAKEFFYCSGNISSMPMTSYNPMIEYVKKMSIKSGQLDNVSFSFIAHENSSFGKMKFQYHNLQVEVMNEEGGEITMKEKVKTYLANRLLVKDSNPGRDGIVRISTIRAVHNPYRGFLFYSMQTILSGIEPAIQNQRNARLLQQKK
ncbi:MAG: hypothetical protein H0W84_14165, partial [Bacteroidetes bacterium]|nr:hypothetical protein [Bacteroidota bacterium]